jgi:hypothetical protein
VVRDVPHSRNETLDGTFIGKFALSVERKTLSDINLFFNRFGQ